MIFGNCLFFAVWVKARYCAKLMWIRRPNEICPHWYCKMPNGNIIHFKLVSDVLPFPFNYLLFKGKVAKLGKGGRRLVFKDYLRASCK